MDRAVDARYEFKSYQGENAVLLFFTLPDFANFFCKLRVAAWTPLFTAEAKLTPVKLMHWTILTAIIDIKFNLISSLLFQMFNYD